MGGKVGGRRLQRKGYLFLVEEQSNTIFSYNFNVCQIGKMKRIIGKDGFGTTQIFRPLTSSAWLCKDLQQR
jgi:hypothetical protein